jgi:carboxyl-terminal processing protease
MMRFPIRRTVGLAALALMVCLTLGALLPYVIAASSDKSEARLQAFARALAIIEDNYVGKATSKDLVENALQGMLRTLDPHSNYLSKDAYSEMRDEQRGKFSGLGIQINKPGPDKPLTIIAPIDGTPASRAGLLAGDIIYKIEGQETVNLSLQEAVRRLKGEKGTKVTITIQRPGDEAPFDITLVRDEIPTHSIPLAIMLQPGTGYVRVSMFNQTTATEMDEAIRRLKGQGMERLLLDLRRNPGGLLEQAVQVSERFIPSGKLVVYTRGRVPGADQDYHASKDVAHIDLPLVVLIDRFSASASEIVSGAIQDHDRGILVGETSFGKGLVQRVIPLRDGGALALTTAKYYTPSGRLIQRDYSDMDEYFLEPESDGEDAAPSEAAPPVQREIRHTDSGRVVYGGGGITPDYVVRSPQIPQILTRLLRENLIFDFATRFAPSHPDLKPDFSGAPDVVEEFKQFLKNRKVTYGEDAFEAARAAIESRLKAQIARFKWGQEGEMRVFSESDPQVLKALTLFEEASRLAKAGEEGRQKKAADDREGRASRI